MATDMEFVYLYICISVYHGFLYLPDSRSGQIFIKPFSFSNPALIMKPGTSESLNEIS